MSMNVVCLQGRLGRDIELKRTETGKAVAAFSVAVDRDYVSQGKERETDWLNIVAWNGTAEFISKHFHKGDQILITGQLRARKYQDKEGADHYVTEIYADRVNFCGSKSNAAPTQQNGVDVAAPAQQGGVAVTFDELDDEDDESLPF